MSTTACKYCGHIASRQSDEDCPQRDKAKPTPGPSWAARFIESEGYDSMTDAWYILQRWTLQTSGRSIGGRVCSEWREEMKAQTYCPAFAREPEPCPLTPKECESSHIHDEEPMSDKAKPTPGPWRVDGRKVYSDAGIRYNTVCEVHDYDEPEGEANARLIAAAPRLREALRGLLEAVELTATVEPGRVIEARAALREADGDE